MQAVLSRAVPADASAFEVQLTKVLPNRRALAIVVERLGEAFDRKSQLLQVLGAATCKVLSVDPALTTLLLRATAKLALPDELPTILGRLADSGGLHLESIAAAALGKRLA